MKLKCETCGKDCTDEIPKEKEDEFMKDWAECPLCVDCIVCRNYNE